MTLRRPLLALLLAASAAPAAEFRTKNFTVSAPTKELAKAFGEAAEKYRVEKAMEWLGTRMPDWDQPCPLSVAVKNTSDGGGATHFSFNPSGGGVVGRKMEIFGGVQKMLHSVLPHEVTHTVLAHRFGRPVPRWADEGGSVLSENDEERHLHDVRCREMLNAGRGIPLGHLFALEEYPRDMHVLYAEGYSVVQFLVDRGGREKFLNFVEQGMKRGNRNWEQAVQVYGFNSTDELQTAWIGHLKNPNARLVAARDQGGDRPARPAASPTSVAKGETRTSAAPRLPVLEPPVVVRGAAPDREAESPAAKPPASPPIPRLLPPEPPGRN
jgi:hypothetical protein